MKHIGTLINQKHESIQNSFEIIPPISSKIQVKITQKLQNRQLVSSLHKSNKAEAKFSG